MRIWSVRALAAVICALALVGCAGDGSDQPVTGEAGTSEVPADGGEDEATAERDVFFADADEPGPGNADEMVAVTRTVPEGSGLAGALRTMLDGPTPEEEGDGLHSAFGQDNSHLLRDAGVDGDRAWVDLDEEVTHINNLTTTNMMRIARMQLRQTAATFGAEAVEVKIEGSAQRWCEVTGAVCDP